MGNKDQADRIIGKIAKLRSAVERKKQAVAEEVRIKMLRQKAKKRIKRKLLVGGAVIAIPFIGPLLGPMVDQLSDAADALGIADDLSDITDMAGDALSNLAEVTDYLELPSIIEELSSAWDVVEEFGSYTADFLASNFSFDQLTEMESAVDSALVDIST